MPQITVSEAAKYMGVSDATVRRWMAAGDLASSLDDSRRTVIEGAELVRLAKEHAASLPEEVSSTSARNKLFGLVSDIKSDTVMSQVEIQCGPYRVVSLMSTDSVKELGLEVGSPAMAVIKATSVIVGTSNV